MTLLWLYNMPLVAEAGGTERITSLIAGGLTARGHRCLGMLRIVQGSDQIDCDGETVDDLYRFLADNHVDVVINQMAYDDWLLQAFLNRGGDRWRREGGRIISCLHFDPRPLSSFYFLSTIRRKTPRQYVSLARAWLFRRSDLRRQERRLADLYRRVYSLSDSYVLLSERHFPYFKKITALGDYSRLTAINNPLTFPEIAGPEILDRKKKVVLVCARMDEYYKRISLVLRAWKALYSIKAPRSGAHENFSDWQLKIVGDGPDLDRFRDLARRLRLRNITFCGRQSPEAYYREASIFLLTSVSEGWGLTLTESLQFGVVPVVMDTSPVYADIIRDGYNGFLSPGSNLRAFTRRVARLMADPALLHRMQLNALESASQFTLSAAVDRWLALLAPAGEF